MTEPNRLTTVGQLRAALEGIPDGTPLAVNAADPGYPEEAATEQVITSAGFGLIDWGDGYGLEPGNVFALNCDLGPDIEDVRRKPVRPVRQPPAAAFAQAAGPDCQTCHASTGLREVTSRSLADGTERTERFCADAAACNDRRFPGLAETLAAGWPGSAEAEAEAEP